jgi:hypothetical protein
MESIVIMALVFSAFGFFFLGGLLLLIPLQAKWRGYSFWLWLSAMILTYNPFMILVMMALMPIRSRLVLREKFRAELEQKLVARGLSPLPDPVTSRPLGDGSTDRSLGDIQTIMPPSRSLGDEETRG